MTNSVFIDYDGKFNDDADLAASDSPTEIKKRVNYKLSSDRFPLEEVFVDVGWEKETLEPIEQRMLPLLRKRFKNRGDEPIPFSDLASAMYVLGPEAGRRISKFNIINMLRHMWRNGEIRRYIKGRSRSTRKGRGESHGVHYSLYPKRGNK